MSLCPVILSGGSGTRLWPMSRESYPKQFLPLLNGRSPFEATVRRLKGIDGGDAPLVVAHQDHRFLVDEQMRRAAPDGRLRRVVRAARVGLSRVRLARRRGPRWH